MFPTDIIVPLLLCSTWCSIITFYCDLLSKLSTYPHCTLTIKLIKLYGQIKICLLISSSDKSL